MADREVVVAKTLTATIEAVQAGLVGKANELLRRAVHAGLDPTDIVLAALAAEPIDLHADQPQEAGPMHVIYSGPEDGVTLAPTAGGFWMPRGEPVEVLDDVGRSLCQQPDFKPAKVSKPSSTKPKDAGGDGRSD